MPQILFLGFFIRIDQMPVFLQWVQYVCCTKYALNLAMLVEFDPSLAIDTVNEIQYRNLLIFNDVSKSNDWVYALILVAIFAGFRLVSLIILNEKASFTSNWRFPACSS